MAEFTLPPALADFADACGDVALPAFQGAEPGFADDPGAAFSEGLGAATEFMADAGMPPDMIDMISDVCQAGFDQHIASNPDGSPMDAFDAVGGAVDMYLAEMPGDMSCADMAGDMPPMPPDMGAFMDTCPPYGDHPGGENFDPGAMPGPWEPGPMTDMGPHGGPEMGPPGGPEMGPPGGPEMGPPGGPEGDMGPPGGPEMGPPGGPEGGPMGPSHGPDGEPMGPPMGPPPNPEGGFGPGPDGPPGGPEMGPPGGEELFPAGPPGGPDMGPPGGPDMGPPGGPPGGPEGGPAMGPADPMAGMEADMHDAGQHHDPAAHGPDGPPPPPAEGPAHGPEGAPEGGPEDGPAGPPPGAGGPDDVAG